MKILDRNTVTENMSKTRTIQSFGTLLRDKPEKLGQVVSMRPDLSISMLTEALRNVYKNSKEVSSFQPINAMAIEWQIDVNFIKRVKLVAAAVGTGLGFTPITVFTEENYFDKNDSFAAEDRSQYFVSKAAKRINAKKWEYEVMLITNDPAKSANAAYLGVGRTVRFRSNYFPELSERGYTKFLSNSETHRNYISRHRASVDWSGDFAIRENVFIADGKEGNETIYKMNKKEKDCLDSFLYARENSMIFSETNFDINGKCTLQDERGRDIPMGDGVIPQIEKVCDKFLFSDLSIDVIEDAMTSMGEKAETRQGNHWTYICNDKFWNKFNKLMKNDLRFIAQDGSYFWSKEKGGSIKVGATYSSYEFAGNTITVMVNQALSIEYSDRAYAIMLDVGKDMVSGRPNIAMFTLEGSEIITGNLNGMGGADGNTSGEISSSIHGSSYHLLGYSGSCVFHPYRSVIMEEHKA
jgi:hypothetical protein